MRSSKSRSRSKANRPRSLGNIVNRVFDSSGPEGKVRGTPQQIIEKYTFLARDAQLSNDRVAAENFLQHAEHYTRMLAEAQREMAAEQEARRQEGQHNGQRNERQDRGEGDFREDRGQDRGGDRQAERGEDRGDQRRNERRDDRRDDRREDRRDDRREDRRAAGDMTGAAAVIDLAASDDEAGLVETPEARRNAPERDRNRPFRRREDANPEAAEAAPSAKSDPVQAETPTQEAPAAETAPQPEDKPRAPRRPRGPRKPKADGGAAPEGASDAGNDPRAAAE